MNDAADPVTSAPDQPTRTQRWLQSVSLHRPELRAWAMYDWANSAFATSIMGTILPVYYAEVAASDLAEHTRTAYWGYTTGFALLIVALISPVVGAAADYLGAKKKFLLGFLIPGVIATAALSLVTQGEYILASVLFIVGNVGFAAANVFYDSFLPHLTTPKEMDRLSTAGYALGYLGGGLLLLVHLIALTKPELFGITSTGLASRLAFISVAVWWAVFSVPLFRRVPEPPTSHVKETTERPSVAAIAKIGFQRVGATFRRIRQFKQVLLFLIGFWFYSDGIGTIIKMATIYGREIGIGAGHLYGAFVLVQLLGVPATFAFGPIAGRLGTKNGIILCLCVYAGICTLGFYMTTAWHFWALAAMVALVQGGCQALSRSLYATIIPRRMSSEFFSFISISSKFAGIIGPILFGVVSQSMGGSRYSILFLISFFIIGMILLGFVDVEKGRAVALEQDAEDASGGVNP